MTYGRHAKHTINRVLNNLLIFVLNFSVLFFFFMWGNYSVLCYKIEEKYNYIDIIDDKQ